MDNIAYIAAKMQDTLGEGMDILGREEKFTQRASKITGRNFVKLLVFSAMGQPEMSYTHMSQYARMVGVDISAQGLEQRFTPEAAKLMKRALDFVIRQKVCGKPTEIEILKRFNGVYLEDSSTISLPKEFQTEWPGVGSKHGPSAAMKLHVCMNYSTGEITGPAITDGRTHDRKSPNRDKDIPLGGLRIADLGFFDLDQFEKDQVDQVFWLSRLKTGIRVYDRNGEPIDLLKMLKKIDHLDLPILLGQKKQIPCRLIVQRVPQHVVNKRRSKLHDYAVRKQISVSQEGLALAQWTLMVTNVPLELLSREEAITLYRVRWQIELLFKLWKKYMRIDEWRTHNPNRILCELYAKLIALLFIHWNLSLSFWSIPNHSIFKAIQVFTSAASILAFSSNSRDQFLLAMNFVHMILANKCSINSRNKQPNTYQALVACSLA